MKITIQLKDELNHSFADTVTTEVRSEDTARFYVALTAHYIGSKWKLNSHLLACRKLSGCHTVQALVETLKEISKSFDIELKLVFLSTDNASNGRFQIELSLAEEAILFEISTEDQER